MPSLTDDAMDILSFYVNEVYQNDIRLDNNTSADEILEMIIFNQYFEELYLCNNDYYTNEEVYDMVIDENGISHELGYVKYYADSIDEILELGFNISDLEIVGLHNRDIHYYNDNQKKWYYKNGYYYVSQQGVDGRLVLDIQNYKVLEECRDNIYKLELSCQERFGFEDEYIGLPFSMYCVLQITEGDFSVYAISIHNDIEYQEEIEVVLNGNKLSLDQEPINDHGRILLPIREIAETMGDEVKWNQPLQTAFIRHNDRALIVPLNTDHLYIASSDKPIEWKKYNLDVPSQVRNGRTLTPVRAFCESLGATVNWDDSTQTVYIEYNGNYDYDSLSDETINGINMAYSIMREHNNISFAKYSEEIYAYLENSNSVLDNVAMSWGSGLFDGIVQLLSGEDATKTAVKAGLAQVISLFDGINRYEKAEIIDGIIFTKSGIETINALTNLQRKT